MSDDLWDYGGNGGAEHQLSDSGDDAAAAPAGKGKRAQVDLGRYVAGDKRRRIELKYGAVVGGGGGGGRGRGRAGAAAAAAAAAAAEDTAGGDAPSKAPSGSDSDSDLRLVSETLGRPAAARAAAARAAGPPPALDERSGEVAGRAAAALARLRAAAASAAADDEPLPSPDPTPPPARPPAAAAAAPGTGGAEDEAAGGAGGPRLVLRLVCEHGDMKLRVGAREPFSRMFDHFAMRAAGLGWTAPGGASLRFIFDGVALRPDETPEAADMEGDEVVEVLGL